VGTVFRPSLTRPMPAGAVVTDGVARWKSKAGKLRTAKAKGERIVEVGNRYLARYRDGQGVVRTVPTGCREEAAARAVLVQLERRAELVKAGVLTPEQDAISSHRRTTVASHVEAYVASLNARGCTAKHVHSQKRLLTTVLDECRFRSLADVKREPMEKWLTQGANRTRSARTRNTYLCAIRWFLNWAIDNERLLANPLARIPLADEKADRRRQPRALTGDEIVRLLEAARRRPLAQAQLYPRGWRKGQPGTSLRPETVAKLERLGRERALAWKTLVLTGLRLGELASLRMRDAVLDGPRPHLLLDARFEKNRNGSAIPLRADLAADLRAWLAGAPPDRPIFALSENQVKVFNKDLKWAGIAKRDDRGRTACVHSLRHSHASLLNRAGVGPQTVQASMRHGSLDMTTVYSDPRLLDVAAALDALPALPLEPAPSLEARAS